MGRFFKTARSQFVDDKLFELPVDQIQTALRQQDSFVDKDRAALEAKKKELATKNLKVDDPAVNSRLKEHQTKIDDLTKSILSDPSNHRARSRNLADLSQEIDHDLSRGLLGKAHQNLKDFTTHHQEVDAREDVSDERKSLIKAVEQKKFNQLGGTNFIDDNTYNRASDVFIQPEAEFDEDKYISEVGKGFASDKTADAKAYATEDGYIRTSSGTLEKIEEKDIEDYVAKSLTNQNWEAQIKQMIELRREANGLNQADLNPDGSIKSIEDRITEERNRVLSMAKNKLGFKKESDKAGLTPDGLFIKKNFGSGKTDPIKNGTQILFEHKPVQDNFVDKNGHLLYSPNDLKYFDTLDTTLKGAGTNYSDIINAYEQGKFNDVVKPLWDQLGIITPTQKETFAKYLNHRANDEVAVTAQLETVLGQKVTEEDQAKWYKGTVHAINNFDRNTPIKSIQVKGINGQTREMPESSLAELLALDQDNFVMTPVTGSNIEDQIKTKTVPTNNNPVLVDENNQPITIFVDEDNNRVEEGVGGRPRLINTYREAEFYGVTDQVVFDEKKIAATSTTDPFFQIGNEARGDLKQRVVKKFDSRGRMSKTIEYVIQQQYNRTPKGGGNPEIVTVTAIIDPKTAGVDLNNFRK